jgi:predicted neuraminidase
MMHIVFSKISQSALLSFAVVLGSQMVQGENSSNPITANKISYPQMTQATLQPDAALPGASSAMIPTLYLSSHASKMILLRNGDLFCTWFSGSNEGDSNVGIVAARLKKGEKTWSPTILIDRNPAKSFQNPVPYETRNGEIWIFHTAQSAGKGQADSQVLKTISKDGGKTWSAPVVIFSKAGSYTRQPLVEGISGELLLPLFYSTSAGITDGAQNNYSAVEVSTNGGKTWKEFEVPDSKGMVHMDIVKLAPKSYVAFYRSRFADFIYRSTSTDGFHWTAPKATPLPNNNASIQAIKLANGHLVMAFNNVSGKKGVHIAQTGPRAPISLAISTDAGLTWSAARDLELPDNTYAVDKVPFGPEEYSYPSLVQLPGGKIIVTYTYRRRAIKSVLVDEMWIEKGTTVGEYKPVK